MNKITSVCVYSASSTKIDPVFFNAARELGTLLGQRHIRLVNGAGNMGLMAAVADCEISFELDEKHRQIKATCKTSCIGKTGVEMEAEPGYVTRGEEKGYFEFGGSTIILLTQKGAVLPRKNILYRSARGEETRIRQGEKIGKVNNNQR